MIRFIFVIIFVLAPISFADASRYSYSPSESQVGDIKIGVVLKTPDGKYIEDGRDLIIAKKIAEYARTNLAINQIKKAIEIETYFPWSCYFSDAKMSRYRPPSEDEQPKRKAVNAPYSERDLNFLIVGVIGEETEPMASLGICIVGSPRLQISYPEDFPMQERKSIKCPYTRPAELTEYILCTVKPEIDGIL